MTFARRGGLRVFPAPRVAQRPAVLQRLAALGAQRGVLGGHVVQRWDVATGERQVGQGSNHDGLIGKMVFRPDGKAYVAPSMNQARVREYPSGQDVGEQMFHDAAVVGEACSRIARIL